MAIRHPPIMTSSVLGLQVYDSDTDSEPGTPQHPGFSSPPDSPDTPPQLPPRTPPTLIVTKGRNNGEQRIYAGYVYSHNRSNANNGNRSWLCKDNRKYQPTCKGRIMTNGDDVIKTTPHCHEPSETQAGVQMFLSSIRTADAEELIPPASKIRRMMSQVPDSIQANLPDKKLLRKQLSTRRKRVRGYAMPGGNTAQDLQVPLPRSPDGTEGLYLLDDVTTTSGKRVLAITCSATLTILNRLHKVVYIDGTFKIAPPQFKQLWILRANILGSESVAPLIFFLLEDKTKVSYSSALDIIRRSCPHFACETAMLDFEKAEHSSINDVFPGTQLRGCFFHWKQCLIRKFGAVKGYPQDYSIREHLHSLFGLAFVPESDVPGCWQVMKQVLLAKSASFLDVVLYVETEWIFNPVYPIRMWNVYNATLDNDARTNNYSEGNNHALNLEVGCAHPSLPRLLQCLEYFNADTRQSIMRILTGQHTIQRPKKKSVELQRKLINAVQLYGLTSVEMYCRSLGHLNS